MDTFVASVMPSLRQPFRPNDPVEIEGDVGRVIRLTSRATILLSPGGNHIRIPDASVFECWIPNCTRTPARRFGFDIGIDPDADLKATRVLAQKALKAEPFVLDAPEELVWIENIPEAGAILRGGGVDRPRHDRVRHGPGRCHPPRQGRHRGRRGRHSRHDLSHPPRRGRKPPRHCDVAASGQDAGIAIYDGIACPPVEEKALIPLMAAQRLDAGDLLARDAPRA